MVFKDYQNLQRLYKKLLKSQGFLEANLTVIKRYRAIVCVQDQLSLGALECYVSQLETCQQVLCRLLKTTDATGETVGSHCIVCYQATYLPGFLTNASSSNQLLCILKYRNNEASRATTTLIHDNGRHLTELVTLSNRSASLISNMATKTHKDSRTTKLITVVAALYLPATLVASVFNSNLVQSVTTYGDISHFVLARDFWMFPVLTIALMTVTLSPVWLWLRRTSLKNIQKDFRLAL